MRLLDMVWAGALVAALLASACTSAGAPSLDVALADAGVSVAGDDDPSRVAALISDNAAATALLLAADDPAAGWTAVLDATEEPDAVVTLILGLLPQLGNPGPLVGPLGQGLAASAAGSDVALAVLAAVGRQLVMLAQPGTSGLTPPEIQVFYDGVMSRLDPQDVTAAMVLTVAAGTAGVRDWGPGLLESDDPSAIFSRMASSMATLVVPAGFAATDRFGAAEAGAAVAGAAGATDVVLDLQPLTDPDLARVDSLVTMARAVDPGDPDRVDELIGQAAAMTLLDDDFLRELLISGRAASLTDGVSTVPPEYVLQLDDGSYAVLTENVWETAVNEVRTAVLAPLSRRWSDEG